MSEEDEVMLDRDDSTFLFERTIHVHVVTKPAGHLQKGDKLFITDGSGQHKSFLGFNDLLKYVIGYKEAADILVAVMMADDSYLDTFVIPAIYLYRHYVELSLKEIIQKGNHVLGKPPEGKLGFSPIHSLTQLWKECEGILRDPFMGITDQQTLEEIKVMGELIKELDAVDRVSMVFRYPMDKNNEPSLPRSWGWWVDIEHVKEMMERIDNFFTNVSTNLEQWEPESYEA
jgi:hypothetical protein